MNVLIDLLWLFYTTGNSVIHEPDIVEHIFDMSTEELGKIAKVKYIECRSAFLFSVLTGKVILGDKDFEEDEKSYEEKIEKYLQYGKSIIRSTLHLFRYSIRVMKVLEDLDLESFLLDR